NNRVHAFEMISSLSGNIHEVYTGVCIRSENREKVFAERTKVEFWPLKKEEIEAYIATEEPYDKAGAYGIQHYGAIFVKQIIGDYFNVVGLPVSRVVRELKQFGIYPNITGDN
ncbi:MAG TPA: Maf family protein, partial [Bacillota bacterium]|nr:Maf family protein [Bacillota bacterium]